MDRRVEVSVQSLAGLAVGGSKNGGLHGRATLKRVTSHFHRLTCFGVFLSLEKGA